MSAGLLPSPAFWSGRRVFLTGHTGFKGAWLAFWLSEMGAEVIGFSDRVPTEQSLFEDAEIAGLLADRRGDIRDLDALGSAMRGARPDVVMHLAAQPLVRYSYSAPVETYATNVMGTVHVLESARSLSTGPVTLIVTTDKCYENREWVWGYRENEAMGGHDPYSSSKGCAELVTSAYARSYMLGEGDFRVLSARAGNVIGGGDWALDRVVPDLVRGLRSGQSVPIRNPDATRPWQHVLEPLCGYLLLCEKAAMGADVVGQGWNFGPASEAEAPVRRVADTMCRLWPRENGWHFAGVPGQLHEANLLRLDSTKATTKLGWQPRWTLEEAIGACVEVYRCDAKGAELRDLMRGQIGAYTGARR